MRLLRLAAAVSLAAPGAAFAQAAEETPICTDRPAKANAVCTVPAGKWQLESSAFSWSRSEVGGDETKVLALGSSVTKLGISNRSDLQVAIMPHVRIETEHGGVKSEAAGVGDVTVRYKQRLSVGNAPVQVAVIPFVKLPTADRPIGNGKVEGGLALPIAISTGGPIAVVLGPELDLLADADGDGRHAGLVNLVNLSGAVAKGVTLAGELWTMTNFDPGGTVTLASADAALAYAVSDAAQLDAGVNIGLTRHTPDTEVYLGLSLRF